MWVVELLRALAELVRALAWPVAALLIVGAILRTDTFDWSTFRASIAALFRRKFEVEAGPGGLRAKFDAEQQQVAAITEPPKDERLSAKQALAPPRPAVAEVEQRLHAEIPAIDKENREPILVRALAETRVHLGHEWVYNRIFGSQIIGLKHLYAVNQTTEADAKRFFQENVRPINPELYASYGFDGWLDFLKRLNLISQDGTTIRITEFGKDFLMYIGNAKLADYKPN